MVKWTIGLSGMYLRNDIVLFIALLSPLLSFFPVFNVARFVTSGYLYKEFIFLCHTNLPSKTYWSNVLSAVGYYTHSIGNVDLHHCDKYYLVWSLHFLYFNLGVIE